jgi:hypothetical protein
MKELVRFQLVEVNSKVWFLCGNSKCYGCKITSVILVPFDAAGSEIMTEVSLPEIFL